MDSVLGRILQVCGYIMDSKLECILEVYLEHNTVAQDKLTFESQPDVMYASARGLYSQIASAVVFTWYWLVERGEGI